MREREAQSACVSCARRRVAPSCKLMLSVKACEAAIGSRTPPVSAGMAHLGHHGGSTGKAELFHEAEQARASVGAATHCGGSHLSAEVPCAARKVAKGSELQIRRPYYVI